MTKKPSVELFFPIFLIVLGVIFVGLTVWGVGFMETAKNLNEYTSNPPSYLFNLVVVPTDDNMLYLNSARFYYDLTDKQAFLAFDINGEKNISEIFMQIPEIDNSTIKCFSANWLGFYKEKDMNYSEIGCSSTNKVSPTDGYNESIVTVILDNQSLNNTRIKISFNLNTEHSFTFKASIYRQNVWYSDAEGNIIISLGKDYECFQDCVYDIRGFNQTYLDNPAAERRLKFVNSSAPQNSFKLITRSIKASDEKSLRVSIGISLIVGALFATISLLIEVIKWIFDNLINKGSSFNLGNFAGFIIFCIGAMLMIAGIIKPKGLFSWGWISSFVGIAIIIFTWEKKKMSSDEKLRDLFSGKSKVGRMGKKTVEKLKRFIDSSEEII